MATNGEKILYLTMGAVTGCVILSILMNSGGQSKKHNPISKMTPQQLRGMTAKLMSAYSQKEYYDVAAGFRDILNDRLNNDGTAKDRPIPKKVKEMVAKRLNLAPQENLVEETVNESETELSSELETEN